MSTKMISDKLHGHGLRVTPQRIWVYDYLRKYKTHPDADEVYAWMKKSGQSVTLSTVYNILQAFVDAGLAVTVTVDGDRVRYDADTSLHGHFLCRCCEKVYDFEVGTLKTAGLNGFVAEQKDIYFCGVCENCNKKI